MNDIEAMREFRIEGWRVQPRRNRVVAPDGTERTLEPKVMEVLVHLARHRGEVVSRESLLDEVWADVHVGEKVLTRAVSEIRRAFGDDPQQPRIVETIIKRGYRLLPEVYVVEAPAPIPSEPGTPHRTSTGDGSRTASRRSRSALLLTVLTAIVALAAAWLLSRALADDDDEVRAPGGASAVTPLTTFPGWEYDPAVSPDGTHIAYVWEGDPRRAWEIHVQQADSDRPQRVTGEGGTDGSPTWSPDGQRLAYYRYRPDTGTCELYESPALGGSERYLGRCGARYPDLSWSPRGDLLALHERGTEADGADASFRIVLLHMTTGDRRPLTRPPAGSWGDHHASFSPDGGRVAFVRTLSEGIEDVYLVDVGTGQERRLTFDAINVRGVTWADDGTLLFASRRGGEFEIWRLDLGGTDATPQRLPVGRGVSNPSYRAGLLTVEEWTSDTNIWRLELDVSNSRQALAEGGDAAAPDAPTRSVIASTRWDLSPAYAPDGDHIAFVSDRSGSHEIWVADADGSDPVRLTHFDGPYVSTPRFSPDGGWILFEARPGGQADLYLIDARGGDPRRLTDHPGDDLWGVFGDEGQRVFFASARSGTWELWRLSLGDGSPAGGNHSAGSLSRVTREGGTAPQLSPDGHHLLYTRRLEGGLWRVPLEGGPEELVYDGIEPGRPGSWTIGRGGVFHVRTGTGPGDPDEILFHDLEGKGTTTVLTVPGLTGRDASLALSPDGRDLLYGRTERVEADLLLVRDVGPGD